MSLPMTVNLMALAAELESKRGNRKLKETLRRAWRAQSCVADLNQVQEICALIDQLKSQTVSIGQTTLVHTQSALMITAIMLYVRATATSGSGRERGSIQLKQLTPQERRDHATLIRIRNSALGHVEFSSDIAGDFWHVDYLFAKQVGPGLWQYASASTSIGLNYDTVAILKRQLPVAIKAIRARCQERLADVQKAIEEASPTHATMLRHQVDPIAWFGSLETARRMLAGAPGEESSSWIPLL